MLISTIQPVRSGVQKPDAWLLGRPGAATEALLSTKEVARPGTVAFIAVVATAAGLILSSRSASPFIFWVVGVLGVCFVAGWVTYVWRKDSQAHQRAAFVTSDPNVFRLDRDLLFQLLRPDLVSAQTIERHKGDIDVFFRRFETLAQALRSDINSTSCQLVEDELADEAIDYLMTEAKLAAKPMGYREQLAQVHEQFWRHLGHLRHERDARRFRANRLVQEELTRTRR